MGEENELTRALKEKDLAYLLHPLVPLGNHEANGPLVFLRGEGCWLYDSEGRDYVDATAGLWNCQLGHGRKDVARAVAEQMERLAYLTTFGGLASDTIIAWAEKLASHLPGDLTRVFPNVIGSEANETAFKIARTYHSLRGRQGKFKTVSHSRSYHGVSMGTVGATGLPDYWRRYLPLPGNNLHVPAPHCYRCPYGRSYPACDLLCADVLEQLIVAEDPDTISAFIAEPVMGGGGIVIAPGEYFPRVRQICDKYDVLYVDDEVITGFGRTGKWFALEHWGVVPDIVTMGKGMTAGYLPMFATAISQRIYRVLADANETLYQGFTYTGQPAIAAAALKVMQILDEERVVERAASTATLFARHLHSLLEYPWVGEVRNLGLLGGVEFVADRQTRAYFPAERRFGPTLLAALRRHGVITRVTKHEIMALCPPLTIGEADLAELFRRIRSAIEEVGGAVATS
ncbi:MAG: aspartate aminotransferase family protein [Chloroflexi bacterium]|nr:aspartate aminotransferase family protein [Chloroflexota bacterium]